ncbi:hypothetical protein AVEN_33352-1 [Araneus ventricosus]|uniref:Uncharacterized protein n=1 Tax=Araneus ventricosus TaxID=182803 RepID=A0A4Y2J6T3_ARAVE|nr:hypothetical protein AVEN_33352-1 [Araneus ventricosus]
MWIRPCCLEWWRFAGNDGLHHSNTPQCELRIPLCTHENRQDSIRTKDQSTLADQLLAKGWNRVSNLEPSDPEADTLPPEATRSLFWDTPRNLIFNHGQMATITASPDFHSTPAGVRLTWMNLTCTIHDGSLWESDLEPASLRFRSEISRPRSNSGLQKRIHYFEVIEN